MSNQAEQERINQVYRPWHGGAALARYAWHRQDILLQEAGARARAGGAAAGHGGSATCRPCA